jgi:hypothetical protein
VECVERWRWPDSSPSHSKAPSAVEGCLWRGITSPSAALGAFGWEVRNAATAVCGVAPQMAHAKPAKKRLEFASAARAEKNFAISREIF